jgi:pilus assembly protein TadC
MSKLKTILAEILGLFVDDGSFALAILVWLALVAFVLPRFVPNATAQSIAPAFFLGLAVVLAESVLRFARNARNSRRK